MQDEIKKCIVKISDSVKNNKKMVAKVILVVFILLLAVILRINEESHSEVTVDASSAEAEIKTDMYVDISGEVNTPGVYEVSSDTRLYEVIEKAGGLTEDADTDSINRAQFVEDGQKIIIPSVSDDTQTEGTADSSSVSSGITSAGLININTASKDELMQITGVGDVIAERIIEYRSSTRFKSIEDIMCVKGIGNATYEKMKSQITV